MYRPSVENSLLLICPQVAFLVVRPEGISLPMSVALVLAVSLFAWAFFASAAYALNLLFKASRFHLKTSEILNSPLASFSILLLMTPWAGVQETQDREPAANEGVPQGGVSMPSIKDK